MNRNYRLKAQKEMVTVQPYIYKDGREFKEHSGCRSYLFPRAMSRVQECLHSCIWRMPRGLNTPQLAAPTSQIPRSLLRGI